jgi:hypothetical protein
MNYEMAKKMNYEMGKKMDTGINVREVVKQPVPACIRV